MIKHFITYALIALLVTVISCENEPETISSTPMEEMDFAVLTDSAFPSAEATKTQLQGDGSVIWSPEDKISVFDGYGNRQFSLSEIQLGGVATFSGSAVPGQSRYLAVYPYDASNSYDSTSGKLRMAFRSSQSASAPGSFDPGCNPQAAILKDESFLLRNIGGLMKFTLTSANVTSVTLSAHDGGTVGGIYDIEIDASGNIGNTTLVTSADHITLIPSGTSALDPGVYYICLSARTYTGGINMTLDLEGGGSVSVGTNSDVVVQRSRITSVGTILTSDDRPKRSLTFTPIEELNQGATTPLSHYAWSERSQLTPIAGTYQTLGTSLLLGGEDKDTDQPQYPRFVRSGNKVLLSYHLSGGGTSSAGNECRYVYSTNLNDWTYGSKFFNAKKFTDCLNGSNTRTYAGANFLKLNDGRIMAVSSTRAVSGYYDRNADGGLAIRYSSDDGSTWSSEEIVYVGTNWEPMPVQLTDGRIQIYYTDSKRLESDAFGAGNTVVSTGTSYIESSDNGSTWLYGTVSTHKPAFAQVRYVYDDEGDGIDDGDLRVMTDQMPAVVQLQGGMHMAAAAESFIGGASYTSYISTAWSDSYGSWGLPGAYGVLPAERSNNVFPGCAPYLMQVPSGEVFLSYNRANVFYMRKGDGRARNFGPETRVFKNAGNGYWGSMYALDSHRIIAGVAGTSNVLQLGQFYLNHAIHTSSHAVTVDSRNEDWSTEDEALWLCSGGDTKATVRCSVSEDKAYFLFEVSDTDISDNDYIELYLSDPSTATVGGTSLRVRAGRSGLISTARYSAGTWSDVSAGVTVRSAYDGTVGDSGDTDHGYLVEISVPIDAVPRYSETWYANFSLYDAGNGGLCSLADVSSTSTDSWIPLLSVTSIPLTGINESYDDYSTEYELF